MLFVVLDAFLEPSCPACVTMENYASSPVSLPALLGAALPLTSVSPNNNPIMKQSMLIWAQFRKKFRLQTFSLQSPIANNHLQYFLPQWLMVQLRFGTKKA